MDQEAKTPTKSQALRTFLLLSVVMAPVLAVILVSGYGFMVWMYQLHVSAAGRRPARSKVLKLCQLGDPRTCAGGEAL